MFHSFPSPFQPFHGNLNRIQPCPFLYLSHTIMFQSKNNSNFKTCKDNSSWRVINPQYFASVPLVAMVQVIIPSSTIRMLSFLISWCEFAVEFSYKFHPWRWMVELGFLWEKLHLWTWVFHGAFLFCYQQQKWGIPLPSWLFWRVMFTLTLLSLYIFGVKLCLWMNLEWSPYQ